MSATKFTASVTAANSSGRIVEEQEDRPIGVAPDDVPEQAEGVVVGPLDVVDEQRERAQRWRASRSRRPQGRRHAGAWPPATGSRTRARRARRWPRSPDLTAASAGVPAAVSRIALEANRLRATRNGPRISSSAVIATHVKPLAEASSAAASRRRVLPMPGSPSRVTAARRPEASRSSCAIASSSALSPDDRAGRPAQLDRERALRPDEGVERAAVGRAERHDMLDGCHVA